MLFFKLPVRYEVNCLGPQRIGKRAVVFTVFWCGCDVSFGKKCVPSDDSPHQRSLTNVGDGDLCTIHSKWLTVTRRKHLSWPSTRGGRLVEGTTSLCAADIHFGFYKQHKLWCNNKNVIHVRKKVKTICTYLNSYSWEKISYFCKLSVNIEVYAAVTNQMVISIAQNNKPISTYQCDTYQHQNGW